MKARKEAFEASSCTKFRLLIWKNFLQQWRHPIQTMVEFLLPVATMSLVLVLRSQIEPTMRDTIRYPPIPAHTLNYSVTVLAAMNISDLSIAYSPESPVLDDVLRTSVANMLVMNSRDIISIIIDNLFPDIDINLPIDIPNNSTIMETLKTLVKVTPYQSSLDLRGIYYEEYVTRKVIAAIEFDDNLLGSSDLPINLSYALRFPEKPRLNSMLAMGGRTWRTDNIFPFIEFPGPRFPYSWEGGNDPGYVNEMFIALQHFISMELVSRISGYDFRNFTVNLQRYPHPAYVEDMVIQALLLIFPVFLMTSFSYTAINIIRAVTSEKELQLKETMKIMGLPTWLHWTAWFCKQFIYLLIASVLIIVLLKVNWFTNEHGFSEYAVFTNTPWTILLFFLMLYLSCMVFFCFMISSFFSKASTAALCGGIIWFVSYTPAVLLGVDTEISVATQAIACLSINTAMSLGFQLIFSKESTGGMQWGQLFSTHSLESGRLLFGHVVIILIVDCILYMLIALYLEQVLPGPFGVPKKWYFPLQKSFWCSSSVVDSELLNSDSGKAEIVIKEKDPTNLAVGVKMTNLTKMYGKNAAVDNLNLNIYDGQITVLLGHNGAGKSTTISMLTGNVEVTHGSVWVAGYNITTQTNAARSHLGLCPQHNVLFGELTVREHLEFFARLKGYSGQQLNAEIDNLIECLEMEEKRNYQANGLSGGQKRRLCVGIALCGGARVVLLDEPTSGMDPASRRALWELLQKMKQDRSIILTTHFMDEADFLGDRVAIMASGRLQCVGSPYFLKRHYGVGYTLVIVKDDVFNLDLCTNIIRKYIPETGTVDDRGKEVAYKLPNEYSHVFEEMLNDLEKNVEKIKFKNYGLVATTLEDVFMSAGSDTDIPSESDDAVTLTDSVVDASEDASSLEELDKTVENETGHRLLWLHVSAVWKKLFLVWARSWRMLLLQIFVPIIIINLNLGVLQYLITNQASVVSRPLTLSRGYATTETLLSYNGTSHTSIGSLAREGYEKLFNSSNIESMALTQVSDQEIDDYYLLRTEDPDALGVLRNQLLIGATFSEDSAVAWFSNFGYHDVATSLAAVHSALLKGINPTAHLTVSNHPLEVNYNDDTDLTMMVRLVSMQVASCVGNSLTIVSSVYIIFYIKYRGRGSVPAKLSASQALPYHPLLEPFHLIFEPLFQNLWIRPLRSGRRNFDHLERVTRAKLLQKAAGMQPIVMWGSAVVFDWLWFIIVCIGILVSCAAFRVIGLSSAAELGRLYLCLMVYGAAMLPMNYLFSLVFNGPVLGFIIMLFASSIFGLIGSQIVEALSALQIDAENVATILDYILQFFPLYSLVTSARLLNQVGLTVYSCLEYCDYLTSAFPNIGECTMEVLCDRISDTCCVRENPYFDWEEPGVLRYLTCMFATCLLSWIVLMTLEYNWIQRLFRRERKAPPLDLNTYDPDVVDEMKHVEHIGAENPEYCLVSKGLTKYYGKNLAVDQISFSVGEAECFGLLGINGAGKTTTFKMLMGDESVSSGDAFVGGFSVKTNITKVYKNIGYCPQFDAIFGELTGRETLYLFSRFRGLCDPSSPLRAETLANALGFTKHLDKRVDQYSGGNRRKLSTAVALLGRTRLVFVDEPTTGVDPAAKRQVWRAVRAARRAGRSLVLTSHSMEECEALCSRLTIMVNGQFQCLGSPQHLKNKFSEGFTLTIKLKMNETLPRNSGSCVNKIETIKNYVNSNFSNPKLTEEYQGLLTFYLPDRSMPWSKMFGVMERAKRELDVEDYSILQTTLEQVFLQFTKYQRDNL